MKSDRLIEAVIPDALRTHTGHPDAELVNAALGALLVGWNESDSAFDAGKAKDARIALDRYYTGVFLPHIAKEDEDWGKLQATAARAPTVQDMFLSSIASLTVDATEADQDTIEDRIYAARDAGELTEAEARKLAQKLHGTFARLQGSKPNDLSSAGG